MGKGGGGGDTQNIQKYEPWSGQKKDLYKIFGTARALSKKPLTYYEGDTVAPFSPQTEQALTTQETRAKAGSPLVDASQNQVQSTIEGDYLNAGNPYFGQMAERVRAQVQPQIDARFATAGAAGSPLANRALGLGLGDALGSLAYQNYGDERQRQLQGSLVAPELANQDYYDIAKLGEVGATKENLQQQQINEQVARHEFAQMEPWERLGLYNQMIQGNYGGTSESQSSGGQRAPVGAGLLGGALGGAGIGGQFGGQSGAAIGGGVGGGLGLLSGLFG